MKTKDSKKSSIAGFIAGCSTMLLFPLEKMKVHMIVSERSSRNHIPFYPSTLSLFSSMRQKGLLYMYRGFHLQTSVSIAWANYFYIYEYFKSLPSSEFKSNHYELYKFSVAACSSIIGNFMSNPLFVIKTRALLLQYSENWFRDTVESLVKTWKVDGVRGFWRGYSVGLFLSLDGAVSMYLYESIKELELFEKQGWNSAFAGGSSKFLAVCGFFPVVLMKMRLQQEQYADVILVRSKDLEGKSRGRRIYEGAVACARDIIKNGGVRGFYRGLWVTLIKVIPTQSLFFAVYDITFRGLDKINLPM